MGEKEIKSNAIYEINHKLVELFGPPKRSKKLKKGYEGYFSLIYKWLNKEKIDLQYLYFVVSEVYQRFRYVPTTVTPGYFNTAFGFYKDRYDPEVNKLPHSGTREELLKAGHTIDTLPFHLLTKEERSSLEKDIVLEEKITDEDRESLRRFLDSL
jgi:hypothetical protein